MQILRACCGPRLITHARKGYTAVLYAFIENTFLGLYKRLTVVFCGLLQRCDWWTLQLNIGSYGSLTIGPLADRFGWLPLQVVSD